MFQEFPKCLYLGGDASREMRIVDGAAQEQQARAEGFRVLGEPTEAKSEALKPARKPRTPKA